MGINIGKIAKEVIPAVKSIDSKIVKDVAEELPKITEQSMKTFSDATSAVGKAQLALAKTSAAKKVAGAADNSEVPEFLYHLTSKKNYEKMLKDKVINVSEWEAQSANGLAGTYMVDKANLINGWPTKCEELFGSMNAGGVLTVWCSKGDDLMLLKVPSKSLDTNKLRFRSYFDTCRAMISGDMEAGKGFPISELSRFKDKTSPLEYVYMDKIPTEHISVESITPLDAPLFESLMQADTNTVSQFMKKLFKD